MVYGFAGCVGISQIPVEGSFGFQRVLEGNEGNSRGSSGGFWFGRKLTVFRQFPAFSVVVLLMVSSKVLGVRSGSGWICAFSEVFRIVSQKFPSGILRGYDLVPGCSCRMDMRGI